MEDRLKALKDLEMKASKMYYGIRERIHTIEDVPRAKALVGQHFKYLNRYTGSEKWWMYIRVVRSNGTDIFLESFQEDFYGKIEFEFGRRTHPDLLFNSGYIPILPKEYKRRAKHLLNKLNKNLEEGSNK